MTTEIPSGASQAVIELHDTIEDHWDLLRKRCETSEQLTQLKDLRSALTDAFWKIEAESFDDDNAEVTSLTSKLNDANREISDSLTELKDIAAFLKLAGDAVDLATSLAKLAVA